jgi:extracellular matrix regulatory protein A
MTTELIHLGFSNMAAIDKVMAIISPNSAPSKRLIHDAKSKGNVIDMTNGRRTKAVLIMDNGHIVLAAITPETIAGRVLSMRKSGPKAQFEEADQAE